MSEKRLISYRGIGSPSEPGEYSAPGGGTIHLKQRDIDEAESNPGLVFEVQDGKGINESAPSWTVVGYRR